MVVAGQTETWRLVWLSPPQLVCDKPEYTCPCIGFQYGERGKLELVRSRPGVPDEHFPLTPLFSESENPAGIEMIDEAVLARWPVLPDDYERHAVGPPTNAEIASRAPVEIMNIADYNHDGHATEFVLQVGTFPCGHSDAVLVGLSPKQPTLHVFGTAEEPDEPLHVERRSWNELLKSAGATRHTVLQCGDHGSEMEREIDLRADSAGLHVKYIEYECGPNFERGRRIQRAE